MEKLTTGQIEDIVDDLRNFDFLPVGRDGRKPFEQICKGAEQMRDELLDYKHLEEQIGCPLKVRCKLYEGAIVYDEDGKAMGVEHISENDFLVYLIGGPYMPRLMYMKGYKKTFWLKADKSE